MTVRVEREGALALVTLARPERLNALTPEMMEQLAEATTTLQQDRGVRAVLLCGEGRAFCAGADVGTMKGLDVLSGRQRIQRAHRVIAGLANMDKPVIAAVRGAAVGVGWSLALACDLILASENASFSLVFKKIGLAPDGAAAYFLTQYIGVLRARELMMSARRVPAAEACALGMVNEVLADDQLDARALDFARELAESATFALAMGKRMFRASMQPSLEAFLDLEAHVQGLVLQSDDRKEGVAAFLAKRKANFVGH
ncbi:enoyl-CoA hydratase/isomerase family protein [Piscinibacter koreensis]|uniref:Enoyl-CoA hydratase/isomerase family protein n=1 Tax=Piscinibacter koreensis TaxID=2742824 RepID=A0A7Y6TXR5_9BURK|nr:enoyl-CoA hydratase-related protein [Schlegelella koreensis]NUZ07443.1 enoyl-CoA hydratase/isomerase family protein [Schlegelella koreensis]